MIVEGKKIAHDMRDALKKRVEAENMNPTLAIVVVGDDPVIASFVGIKRRFAEKIGVNMHEYHLEHDVSPRELNEVLDTINRDNDIHSVVLQLPLPNHIELGGALAHISPEKDVDVISPDSIRLFEKGEGLYVPPVAGACGKVLETHNVEIAGKDVVVVGVGRLVGKPVSEWFRMNGANVEVLTKETFGEGKRLQTADIVVLGAGSSHLITADMVKDGVIILDAGTSEAKGRISGDADPGCAEKAALFTPVPGGIGPITVAKLFENVLQAYIQNKQ